MRNVLSEDMMIAILCDLRQGQRRRHPSCFALGKRTQIKKKSSVSLRADYIRRTSSCDWFAENTLLASEADESNQIRTLWKQRQNERNRETNMTRFSSISEPVSGGIGRSEILNS